MFVDVGLRPQSPKFGSNIQKFNEEPDTFTEMLSEPNKPRLGEFVQQGNIKSISCIVKGDPFYLLSIFSSECGLAQLILPLFVFFERVEA